MITKDTIVVDLDGTLSDGSARYYLVKGKHRDYDAFHKRLREDPPNQWCVALIRALVNGGRGLRVVLVSARPESAMADTTLWLAEHLGDEFYDALFLLRRDGDSTPDQELKRAWLRAYGKERVLFTVDDRQKVVDMWREEGLTCLQCAAWAADKEKTPCKRS